MTYVKDYTIKDVQDVYDGPGGLLWEAVMGEQIHSGGPEATDILATKLGLQKGMLVCDICSALGAPARHLASKYGVFVKGVDATKTMLEKARQRTKEAKLEHMIEFYEGNAMDLPFKKETFDIVWGQEAWCYVTDKDRLIKEAYRVLKPGGKIGFTDWIITGKISKEELDPLYDSMAFPYMETFEGYQELLKKNGFKILEALDQTEEFAKCFDEYYDTVHNKLKPTIIQNFGQDLFNFASNLVTIWRKAAHEHKVGRGLYIAQK
ncbi:MAG: methyltransferase domain-containing protein [candidate division WOR-3 bacterium]|nr:methyltransferase domain-containing protein [candidate division WOR-3 bacterium]